MRLSCEAIYGYQHSFPPNRRAISLWEHALESCLSGGRFGGGGGSHGAGKFVPNLLAAPLLVRSAAGASSRGCAGFNPGLFRVFAQQAATGGRGSSQREISFIPPG